MTVQSPSEINIFNAPSIFDLILLLLTNAINNNLPFYSFIIQLISAN